MYKVGQKSSLFFIFWIWKFIVLKMCLLGVVSGVPNLLIFQKSADFEMPNADFSVSNQIFEMRNLVKFIRNIMENQLLLFGQLFLGNFMA
jgi:hypothetical protein